MFPIIIVLNVALFNFFGYVATSKIAPAFYGLERAALEYELPPLLYTFDELEPYLDEATAKAHYFEHHGGYIQEVNAILKRWRRSNVKGKHASRMSLIDILRNLSQIPILYRADFNNYGSGLLNHNLYWATMSPNPHGKTRVPMGEIAKKINLKFGSFLQFKSAFTNLALNHFGSGYVWLCRNSSVTDSLEDLVVVTSINENSTLNQGLLPILGLDIWEHAYVIKLHNQKAKYIENWWYLVDWKQVDNLANWWLGFKSHDEL